MNAIRIFTNAGMIGRPLQVLDQTLRAILSQPKRLAMVQSLRLGMRQPLRLVMGQTVRKGMNLVCLTAALAVAQIAALAMPQMAGAESPVARTVPVQEQGARIILHTESAAPVCLAMDAHGALYLADEQSGTIRYVTRDGESGVLVSGLSAPCAIAVSHRRELVVGTRLGEIWKVMPDGSAVLAGRMEEPVVSVTMDRDGAVLAATATGTVLRIPAQ